MKKGFLIMAILTVLAITGCGKQVAAPVEINEEVDKCQVCNMQVVNNPSATEIILKNGQALKFDDIGCMNEWKKQHPTEEVDVKYVRDYYTKQWVTEEDATYAYDPTYQTPMAYGIFSFKESKDAQKFVDEQKKGKIMTAADLKNHTWERNKEMMKMHMKNKMNMSPNSGMNNNNMNNMNNSSSTTSQN